MTAPVTLSTARLHLGAPKPDWLPAFSGFCRAPRSSWFPELHENGGAWRFTALSLGHWALEGYGPFFIYHDDTPIGCFAIWHPAWRADPGLFWLLFDGFEGQGFITEAAGAIAAWTLENTSVRDGTSHIHHKNTRSQRVAERLGGQLETTFERDGATYLRYRHQLTEMAA